MDEDHVIDGLPDYFFLMLSEHSPDAVAGGLVPTGMPDYATAPATGGFYDTVLSFFGRPILIDTALVAAAFRLSWELGRQMPTVPFWMLFTLAFGAMMRVRISMEGMFDFEKSLDDRAQRRVEDSIDHLALANNAMFVLMAERLGLTEDDLTARMNEIYNASFKKFAAQIAGNMR